MKRHSTILFHLDKKRIVFIALLLVTYCVKAQVDKEQLLRADDEFNAGSYSTSIKTYERAYPYDSNSTDLNYKLGICNFEIKKFRKKAKKYFDKVNRFSYPEVNYYLGILNHLEKDYDKAINCFTLYKENKFGQERTEDEINYLIEKCNTAKLFDKNTDVSILIENLGSKINSEYPDYAPLIPAEENMLIFTSRRKNTQWPQTDPLGEYFEDIYFSKKEGVLWQSPIMLDSNVNTSANDACTGLSTDGQKLLITRSSQDLKSGHIYESFFQENAWSPPQVVGTNVNSFINIESSACYSPDGDIIFFSSNRPGGFGGKDLYLVRKLLNGKWGEPFNLGSAINTDHNEESPYVHPTGKTLYFSSEGHENMGGYDIFKSNFDETGGFTPPKNIGSPINTVDDDLFFVLNTNGSTGYLSSERKGGFGFHDIYKVIYSNNVKSLNVNTVLVYDDETNTVIKNVEIIAKDVLTDKFYGEFKSNERTGKAIVIVILGKEYELTINAIGYESMVTKRLFDSNNNLVYRLKKK